MKSYKEDSNTTRIAVLETIAFDTKQMLEKLDKKIDKVDTEIKNAISQVNNCIWTTFLWTLGTFIVGYGGTIFTVLKMLPNK